MDPRSLEAAAASLEARIGSRPAEIVLLVHGFNTTEEWGREQYRQIAGELREQAADTSLHVEVVGVHWQSYPGPAWKWIPQVVGYRAIAELGFRRAIRNPYWKKVELARRTGREGLREALFHLQEQFPQARFHALAHSMGSEVVLRALAPEREAPEGKEERTRAATEPDRELRLGLVALAGADLDEDVFASEEEPTGRLALERADLWWVTVSKSDIADAVLELRRGAGRRDAIGNRGLTLFRGDLERLFQRRGLVIDDQEVPITHRIEDYYAAGRLHEIMGAITYLRDPSLPAGQASIPAALQPYNGTAPAVRYAPLAMASMRLYAAWREKPQARSYGVVRISEHDREERRSAVSLAPAVAGR